MAVGIRNSNVGMIEMIKTIQAQIVDWKGYGDPTKPAKDSSVFQDVVSAQQSQIIKTLKTIQNNVSDMNQTSRQDADQEAVPLQ